MTLHSRGAATKGINLKDLRLVRFPEINVQARDTITHRLDRVMFGVGEVRAQAMAVARDRQRHLEGIQDVFAREMGLSQFPMPWNGRLYTLYQHKQGDRFDVLGANTAFVDACAESKKFVRLEDVCAVDGTNRQIPVGQQKYLAIDALPGGYWSEIEPAIVEVEESVGRKCFETGDIAWAHLKPSILQGKAFIVREPCWGSHHFLRICVSRLDEECRFVLWSYLKLVPIRRHLSNQCTGKSESQKDISADQLGRLPFPKLEKAQVGRLALAIRSCIAETNGMLGNARRLTLEADRVTVEAKENVFDMLDDAVFDRIVAETKEVIDTFRGDKVGL